MPPSHTPQLLTQPLRPHQGISRHVSHFKFSTSQPLRKRKMTRQRTLMQAWLRGPGSVFRKPLKNSSNYLSAYNKEGKLLRVTQEGREAREKERDEPEEDTSTEQKPGQSRDGADVQAQGRRDSESRDRKRKTKQEVKIPPETSDDLQPFPLNPYFKSHPVLSLPLRERIYQMVTEDKRSVREVSQTLGVDMNRVGAVVRLKRVEEDWLSQVSPQPPPFPPSLNDENHDWS